jgi:hypothetical protein
MVNLCPKCGKGEIQSRITFEGMLFNINKVELFFCPLCDFRNRIVVKSSLSEKQTFLEGRVN